MKIIGLISVIFIGSNALVSVPLYSPSKDEIASEAIVLNGFWDKNCIPEIKKGTEIRRFSGAALSGLSVGYPMDRIEKFLAVQQTHIFTSDKKSNKYGNMFWYYGDEVLPDLNGVEFCTQKNALIWILYREKLSFKAKNTLSEILSMSAEGIMRHKVRISYTNIILMKIWNLIALGDYFDRPDLSNEGYKLLDEWITYTYNNGIAEYLSPTYYAVGFENLSLIYYFAKRGHAREQAKAALEYFWTDISLNWYAPSFRLGGTHSRDYDRLTGHGDIDTYVRRTGWTADGSAVEKKGVFSFYSFVPASKEASNYRISFFPRFVTQRWGEGQNQYSVQYLGKNFSIGSAGANYYNMDKSPLVIQLGGGEDTPVINYFMDGRSDYYGKDKILEGSGHMKSLHLKPFIASVQNKNEVLFYSSVKKDKDVVKKCESIITLPSDSDIFIDNRQISGLDGKTWIPEPSPNNTTTFLKDIPGENDALRLVDLDADEGVGIQRKYPAIPGHVYTFSAETKGEKIFLYLNFYDKNKQRIGDEHIVGVPARKDYLSSSVTFTAPDTADSVIAWLYSVHSAKTDVNVRALKVTESFKNKSVLLSLNDKISLRPVSVSVDVGSTLFVRRENSVAALRFIAAMDSSGERQNTLTLSNDGLQYGALSFRINHSRSEGDSSGAAAVYAVAQENIKTKADYALFRSKIMGAESSFSVQGKTVDVNVKGINGEMKISVIPDEAKITALEGFSPDVKSKTLSVNGVDVGKKILDMSKKP